MQAAEPLVSLHGVVKDYRELRPLRVERFALLPGESVALLGFDRAAAEVFVNLITAATLPDSGDVDIFGASTREITDPDAWFHSLDRFGIVSDRVVLVDQFTVEQNLTLPISLEVEETSPDVRSRVARLADEVRIPGDRRKALLGSADPVTKLRVRLGKALALNPRVLLAEHPNAAIPQEDVSSFASDLTSIAASRGLAMVVLTADMEFARAVCKQVLALEPATGKLTPVAGWKRWLGR